MRAHGQEKSLVRLESGGAGDGGGGRVLAHARSIWKPCKLFSHFRSQELTEPLAVLFTRDDVCELEAGSSGNRPTNTNKGSAAGGASGPGNRHTMENLHDGLNMGNISSYTCLSLTF